MAIKHYDLFEGRVGQIRDLVEFDNGCVINFSVAETPRKKVNNEWVDDETIWTEVSLWNELARSFVASAVKPGTIIMVYGRREAQSYTPKDSDKKVVTQKVTGEAIAVSMTRFQTVTEVGNVDGSPMKSSGGQATRTAANADAGLFDQTAQAVQSEAVSQPDLEMGDGFSLFSEDDDIFNLG